MTSVMDVPADIAPGRLSPREYEVNFDDATPPLNRKQALIEAARCYFCYDAPCMEACPTGIDIPSFIRKIATDNVKGAAVTILETVFARGSTVWTRPGLPIATCTQPLDGL